MKNLIIHKLNNYIWKKKFAKLHPELNECKGENNKLRLIIGTARSGTNWLSNVLAATSTPIRYISEPLFRVIPKLNFSYKNDHAAIRYYKELNDEHPLIKIYKSLTYNKYSWEKLFGEFKNKKILRNDKNFEFCLIKEVHALLQTENIVKRLNCPAVLMSRNPLRVVDSNLSILGLSVPLWLNEFDYLKNNEFLDKYFPKEKKIIKNYHSKIKILPKREKIIYKKILAAGLIRAVFKIIAEKNENVIYVKYEDLCESPEKIFKKIAYFFSLKIGDEFIDLLKNSQKSRDEKYSPYSIYRDTKNQPNKPFKFINQDEIKWAKNMLNKCNLN